MLELGVYKYSNHMYKLAVMNVYTAAWEQYSILLSKPPNK